MNHLITIISIMFFSGILGGIINFLLKHEGKFTWKTFWRSLLLGLGASLLVPLFLQMISSNLIESATSNHQQYFVFLGFCLVSAISSKAFIESISERVLKEAKEAKKEAKETKTTLFKLKDQVDPIIEHETEQDEDDLQFKEGDLTAKNLRITKNDIQILESIDKSPYVLRSVRGIISDLKLSQNSREPVRESLNKMKNLQLVGEAKNLPSTSPKPRWYITNLGRALIRKEASNESLHSDG